MTPVTDNLPAPPQISRKPRFPFLDLQAQFATIRTEVMAAIDQVFETQHFILGEQVAALESEIANLVQCKYAIGCASGSDALLLALMALGIGDGDDVITTPFTFGATAGAIARLNARPVFVDIEPLTYNLDPKLLERALTPRTRAILPVHLFGQSADMDAINELARQQGIAVIEDAAQAIGALYNGRAIGSIGDIGCFSFFPSKNLGCAGDGGMATTNDTKLSDRLRLLRVHGSRKKYEYEIVGANSRLDALQAAILLVKLPHLEDWIEARRRNAARYRQIFTDAGLEGVIQLPSEIPGRRHVFNQYVIRVAERDRLREHLRTAGIPTEVYYPSPLHLQPAFTYLGHQLGDFPQAESASSEVLALPIFPELEEEQQHSVVNAIAEFFATSSHK